jgi:hypothetical protein
MCQESGVFPWTIEELPAGWPSAPGQPVPTRKYVRWPNGMSAPADQDQIMIWDYVQAQRAEIEALREQLRGAKKGK